MAVASPSIVKALKPGIQANLYAFYDELRSGGGLSWDRHLQSWIATSYELVSAGAGDPRLSSVRYPDLEEAPEQIRPLARLLDKMMLYSDAPTHPRLRALVSKAFTARSVESLRERIASTVDRLISAAAPGGQLDVVADLGRPLPLEVICDLLDVPAADRAELGRWSSDLAHGNRESTQSVPQIVSYFGWLLERQRDDASDSLLQGFLRAEENGSRLSEEELLANSIMLLMAGNETTTNLIGNGTLALLQHPDQLRRLIGDPALIRPAIEELLRYDAPVHIMVRRARQDIELAGCTVRQGEMVLLVPGAANRDPAAFPDPHTLDFDRSGARHLAFGHGPHFCLGASLARLEGEVAILGLITKRPGLRLAHDRLQWQRSLHFRALTRLDVAFTA